MSKDINVSVIINGADPADAAKIAHIAREALEREIEKAKRPGGMLWCADTSTGALELISQSLTETSLGVSELLAPLPVGHRVKGLDELVDEILAPAIAGQTLTKVTLEAAYDIAKARIKLRAEHGE